ncbi:MAG: SBBP repeat-containing protein [Candidatus Syntrophosphaera sp.]|nr:SBBP repeat-containing protein [Candidatus Syntrophosphaera sp.]
MHHLKGILLSVALICCATLLSAQAPDWLWVESTGSTEYDVGYGVSTDSAGNSYVIGYFEESVTFGDLTLTSAGSSDIFVAKLGPSGNWIWARRAGGLMPDFGYGISTDNTGNSYITGYFMFTADFGATTLTSDSFSADIFVAKLDADGNWLWAKRAGGSLLDHGYGITHDSNGNCYLTGFFMGTADFGSLSLVSSGYRDVFVAKLDTSGEWIWAESAGGPNDETGYGIATDGGGNCFVTGGFADTAQFGSISLTANGSTGDIFVAGLNAGGNWIWANRAGESGSPDVYGDYGYGIASDSNGNCYVTGIFYGPADFGNTNLTGGGSGSIFAAKLGAAGNWLWATDAVGNYSGDGFGICVDDNGNSFVTGGFGGTAEFGATNLTHYGSIDIFVAKLSAGGNWIWAVQAGGSSSEWAQAIALDNAGNSFVTGHFWNTADFGSTEVTSSGEGDIFIAKLSPGGVEVEDELAPGITGLSSLHNAYPNPFRKGEAAIIKTRIASRETGLLTVHNLRGQLVASHTLASGYHQISLDSRGLPSGIYLYRLQTDSVNEVRKLVLIK